ncbi:MAG: hypothetical protein GKR98_10255 [Boseongicola sp.]|nr:MAG: hypothetical protein GKR98_10255 [Boseongicola sp.]
MELGEGADYSKFLGSISEGKVYLDPAAKVTVKETKKRCQFRVSHKDLPSLYKKFGTASVG